MGDNDRNDPLAATEPLLRRLWRRPILLIILAAGLALACFLFRDRLIKLWRAANDLGNGFPPGALADYVPEDSQAVLAVNLRQVREAPAGRQYLAPALQYLIRQAGQQAHWLELLGINPLDDLDYLQISFAPATGEPLWLVRARLDRSRIQIGPDKLQETSLDSFHGWEHADHRNRSSTFVVPVGDMLLVSESRGRVQSALKQASNLRPLSVRDSILRELLAKMDRRQTVWLAASLTDRSSLRGIEDYWLRLLLRPLLAHAESVYGEIICTDELRANLSFHAPTEEEAASLEMSLQNIRDLAGESASLLVRRKELLPLLQLLAAGQMSRDGTTIQLRCRMEANPEEKR